jgi:hypothetical protein
MYSDFSPPKVSIRSADTIGDSLKIGLDAAGETVMVELAIDGRRLDRAVLSGFDDIRLDMTAFGPGNHELRVTAYDKYLNASTAVSSVTGMEESRPELAASFQLSPNYPNPFNPETTIPYRISRQAHVTFVIFDLQGRTVKILNEGWKNAGDHSVRWDGTGMERETAASGTYFYRMEAGTADGRHVRVGKMLLVR